MSADITKGMETLSDALDLLAHLWERTQGSDHPIRMETSVQTPRTRADQSTQTGPTVPSSLNGGGQSYARITGRSGIPKRTASSPVEQKSSKKQKSEVPEPKNQAVAKMNAQKPAETGSSKKVKSAKKEGPKKPRQERGENDHESGAEQKSC